MLTIVPCTLRAAHAFVAAHHRHHQPAQGGLFAVAVAVGGAGPLSDAEVVGVAVIGKPVARMLDNGFTAEVTRLCARRWPTPASSGGIRNGCSALYGAAWKAARALGYRRLVTYTLTSESGASLRAAGWLCYGPAGGGTWDRTSRARCDKAPTGIKLRWQQEATT